MIDDPTPLDVSVAANEEFARDLAERARTDAVEPVAPGGLLTGLTKTVLETALAVEIEDRWASIRVRAASASTSRRTGPR